MTGWKRVPLAMLVALSTLSIGCSRLTTEYGKTDGLTAKRSLNGFAALRKAYEQAGFRDRDVHRLSDRVKRNNVIVWTPQTLIPIESNVTRWFDRWLRQSARTLVYVVPDSGSEADYWIETASLAPPEQRLEYRRRAARAITQRMIWRNNRVPITSNGWFRIDPLVSRAPLESIQGPWQQSLPQDDSDRSHSSELAIEIDLLAYDPDESDPNTTSSFGPTGPAGQQWWYSNATTATTTPVQFRELLETGDGKTVLAQVTSDRWHDDSQILVVAGGSLLTNYALSRPFNRQLADQLITASRPASSTELRAGFLTSDWSPIPVSERKPGVPEATGMELLTVWPLSMVTMHGLILGIVICLMLLPIFGRPRRVVRDHEGDFGHHLDAVAALMNRAGGESFARARISEYMKRMHGETSGRWVLPDAKPPVQDSAAQAKTSGLTPKPLSRPGRPNPSDSSAAEPTAAASVVTSHPDHMDAAASQQHPDAHSSRPLSDNDKAER